MAYQDFTQFPVYKKAFDLLLKIYNVTKEYPVEERFGLTADTRRSANSVTHNIPEGYGRFENRDKSRFYKISRASAYEIISQILVAEALNYLKEAQKVSLVQEYRTLISELDRLIKTIEQR